MTAPPPIVVTLFFTIVILAPITALTAIVAERIALTKIRDVSNFPTATSLLNAGWYLQLGVIGLTICATCLLVPVVNSLVIIGVGLKAIVLIGTVALIVMTIRNLSHRIQARQRGWTPAALLESDPDGAKRSSPPKPLEAIPVDSIPAD